jgi:hypothetical protein
LFWLCSSPFLIVSPLCRSGRNVRRLTALGSTAEQHKPIRACSCEIDTVARSTIDAKLPDAVTAEPVIAGIAVGHSIDTSQYRHSAPEIAQPIEPLLKRVAARRRQVVLYVVPHFRF